jgi:hypothetical protein
MKTIRLGFPLGTTRPTWTVVLVPWGRDTEPGVTVTMNVGAEMVSDRLAVRVSPPLAPCTVMVNVPRVAESVADKITFWLWPAAMVKGAGGEELTSAGKPEKVMVTVPEKPADGFTVMVIGPLVAPCSMVTEEGDTVRLKLGCGGARVMPPAPPPPPHPMSERANADISTHQNNCDEKRMVFPLADLRVLPRIPAHHTPCGRPKSKLCQRVNPESSVD